MKIEKNHSIYLSQIKPENSQYASRENLRIEDKDAATPRTSFRRFKAQQCEGVKLGEGQKYEVTATLTNTTDAEVRVSISEIMAHRPPHLYSPLTEIVLSPGQSATVLLKFDDRKYLNRVISIETDGGNAYGMTGNSINIDLCKTHSLEIDLYPSDWIYPGEDFWYIDPFRVIYAKARN